MALINDFNDEYFNRIHEFLDEICKNINEDFNEKPSIEDLCELMHYGIHSLPDDSLKDLHPYDVASICAKIKKRKSIRLKKGDLIGIPVAWNSYILGVYIDSASFGSAYGFFKGLHPIKTINDKTLAPWFSAYTGKDFVIKGKWRNFGSYPHLLNKFAALPEYYHRKDDHPDNNSIGPYGSAEDVDGNLRKLTKEEAKEIGLLDGTCEKNCMLEEMFETYILQRLKAEQSEP